MDSRSSTLEGLCITIQILWPPQCRSWRTASDYAHGTCAGPYLFSWEIEGVGQLLNEKNSRIKWEIRESWLEMNTAGRTEWEKEQRTWTRKRREKRSEGEKAEWSTSVMLKASIPKPKKKAFKVQSLICLPLSSFLFYPFFPTVTTKRETWMQLFDVANSFQHQTIDRGCPEPWSPSTPLPTHIHSLFGSPT